MVVQVVVVDKTLLLVLVFLVKEIMVVLLLLLNLAVLLACGTHQRVHFARLVFIQTEPLHHRPRAK